MGEPRELQQQSVPPRNDAQLFPQHEGPSTEAGFGADSRKREGYQDEPWHLSMGILGPGLHARFDAQMDIDTDVIPSIVDAFNTWSRGTSGVPAEAIEGAEGALRDALDAIGIERYLDGVNPDVRPTKASP